MRARSNIARWATAVLGAAGVALACAAVALADREQIHLTAEGQAAARAAVLTRADLGTASGWSGGMKKPDNTPLTCPSYAPKQSDLVVNGSAESVWKHAGLELDAHVDVLQTPAMVQLDWQRSVLSSKVMPCLRYQFAKHLPASERLVSFTRLRFPLLAADTRAYRLLIDVASAGTTVRVMTDVVVVGRGRTELTLTTAAPYVAASVVAPAELHLARLLVSRFQA